MSKELYTHTHTRSCDALKCMLSAAAPGCSESRLSLRSWSATFVYSGINRSNCELDKRSDICRSPEIYNWFRLLIISLLRRLPYSQFICQLQEITYILGSTLFTMVSKMYVMSMGKLQQSTMLISQQANTRS